MTENPASAEFEKHSPKMCCEVPQELLEKVKKEEGCQNVLSLRHSFRRSVKQHTKRWMLKEQCRRLCLMSRRLLVVEECDEMEERRHCC